MNSLYIAIFTSYSEETKEIILYDAGENINKIVKDLDFLHSVFSLKIVGTNFFSFCHGPSV